MLTVCSVGAAELDSDKHPCLVARAPAVLHSQLESILDREEDWLGGSPGSLAGSQQSPAQLPAQMGCVGNSSRPMCVGGGCEGQTEPLG